MQQPRRSKTVTLDEVTITQELPLRSRSVSEGESPRRPDLLLENQALHTLARQMVTQPQKMLSTLVDIALDLCTAGTAGVSELSTTSDGEEIFCWNVLAGTLSQYVGGTTERDFSPCGVCLDRGTPVLFSYPERYFTYLQEFNTPIVEALVLPLIADSHALGTIWVISHDDRRHFDCEDVRVMTSLADFTAAFLRERRQAKELLAANAALEAEIVEHQRTQISLRELEERSRQLLEHLPGGAAFVVDRDLCYLLAEGEALSAAGFKSENLVGRTIFEVLPPELIASYETLYRQALTGESFEYEHNAHDRTYISRGTPLRYPNGEVYAALAVSYDITDRKRVEAALQRSEEKYRTLVSATAKMVWTADANGNIIAEVPGWESFTGQTFDEYKNFGWLSALHPDDVEQTRLLWQTAIEDRTTAIAEYRLRAVAGDYRRVVMRGEPLLDADGNLRSWVGTITDVEDMRRAAVAEQAALDQLRQSEAKYRSLFESIDDGFCTIEVLFDETKRAVDYRFLDVNPSFEKQTGIENAVGKRIREIAPQHEAHWFEIYGQVATTGESIRFENRAEQLNRWYDVYAFRVGEPALAQVGILFNDITERKQSEQELTKTNQLLQATFDNSLQVIQLFKAVRDERGDIADFEWLLTNKQWNDQWGRMVGKRLLRENPAVVETGLFDMFKQVTESGVPITHEHHYAHEQFDGWFLQTIAQVEDGFLLSTIDTTERKLAEEAVRASEAKYRSLFNSIDEGFHIIELIDDEAGEVVDYRFLEVNQVFERQTGLKNAVGKLGSEIAPKTESYWLEGYDRVARTGEPLRIENYNEDTERWYSAYASHVGGAGSRQVAIVFDDITDRKRTEANLAFLAEVSQDLTRLTNIDETMDAIGAKIGGHFNVARVVFAEISEDQQTGRVSHEWHQPDLPDMKGSYATKDYFSPEFELLHRAGEIAVVRDTAKDEQVDAQRYAALGVGAFVGVPLIRQDKWRFYFSLLDAKARDWRDDEIELLRELTTRIWTRLESARAEAALRVSEEKYRALFNSMDEAYAVIEVISDEAGGWSDFLFLEVNPAFMQHTGMEYPVGRTVTQLLGTPNPQWAEIYGQVAQTGEALRIEMTEDSLNRVFDLNIFRLGSLGSRRVAVLFTDITERKRAEDERKRAQEAMRVFFSNVSHEFRTPLTLLLSSIQETLNDLTHPPSPAQRSQLQLAHRNAKRLLKLVNTLLNVSRIEASRIQAVYEPTDLANFTTELASSFESAIEQAGLQLTIDCPSLPQPVYVDRSIWETIVLNLLSNALKFTFAGEITVRLTSASNWVELTVQDTGIGIPAAELPRLLERFYQVKQARGRSFEGSGIGLSLVQELVKLHGGTIGVSSVEGEGSCFQVSIPIGFAHLPPQQIGAPQTLTSTTIGVTAYVEEALGWLPEESGGSRGRRGAGGATTNSQFTIHNSQLANHASRRGTRLNAGMRFPHRPLSNAEFDSASARFTTHHSPRILLVDDNADMRAYLKRLLSQRWQVETAANGAIALAQIQRQPPDLVLTDVMMPQMDGLQLLQALRADPQTKSIPIILLSARAGEEATIEGLAAGADDYLTKPFSARELMARVETHLQLAWLRQERSANRFKNEFLMTVTHELQAPLAAILGWARLLQSKSFDGETTARALATIERNATIEAKLIKDLLDVSSILSGKLQLKPQLVDLVSLVQGVVTPFREAAGAKSIQLVETSSNVALGNVLADGDRLRQIIASLLDNAIKFTPQGGQVDIRLERLGSVAQITVTDTGIGIAADFLPSVFNRFTQAEVPSRHSPGGVGIGLAIARHLVELHHGTIEAASNGSGCGATFTVKLPLV